jgi:hypothetical protein
MSNVSELELNHGKNIVSLESLDDIADNYLLRAPKKGKIIKGPNWTAYKRENLGTIPRKVEKVLIEDRHKTTRGFSSQSERFSARNQSEKYFFPGPGSYQNSQDTFNTTSSSFSSKGYGNGFASNSVRFDDPKFYYDQFMPGPGQYKVDQTDSIFTNVDKNMNYKYLYHKSEIKSLKVKKELPGPGFYNPKIHENKGNFGPLCTFQSKVDRFQKETFKTEVPGPGKYFNDDSPEGKQEPQDGKIFKGNTLSYFFKLPSPKKEDPLYKYINKDGKLEKQSIIQENPNLLTIDSIQKENENFKNKTGSINLLQETKNKFKKTHYTNSQISTGYFPKSSNSLERTKRHFLMTINNKYRNKKHKINANRDNSSPNFQLKQNMIVEKTNINEDRDNLKEALYLKEILGKADKRPLFELSPPRWSEKISNHNPGPAYYKPLKIPDKIHFYNENLSRWI